MALGSLFPLESAAQNFLDPTISDRLRCRPNEICGGTPTGPVSPCIFIDQCRTPGVRISTKSTDASSDEGSSSADTANTYPSVVALVSGFNVQCSGTLVANKTVLTAAHCFCGEPEIDQVYLGHDIKTREGVWFDLTSYELLAPEFCEADEEDQYHLPDLAVAFIDNDRTLNDAFKSTPLWDVHDLERQLLQYRGNTVIVGFGASEEAGRGGHKRMAVLDEVWFCSPDDHKQCRHVPLLVAENHDDNRVDTCDGDSGGPLLAGKLIGVTREGIQIEESPEVCGYGGFYSILSLEAVDWLKEVIRD